METLGNYLREEREKQGKTLKHIAQKTCISRTTLQAIEEDQDELLPPASYLRGFLKLYAQELGLNTEDLLARLPQQRPKQNSPTLPPAPDIETKQKPLLKIFVVAGIVCIACIWAWQMFFGLAPVSQKTPEKIISPRPALLNVLPEAPDQPDTAPNESKPELEPLPQLEPVSETLPADTLRLEETPPVVTERFTVQFAARGIVWMTMQADDGTIVDITLRDGERYRASAAQKLTVRLGNPVLVDVEYNNQPVPIPGKPGIPLNLVFPDCVQQSPQNTN
jgi:cytoskeleton protein RodZ